MFKPFLFYILVQIRIIVKISGITTARNKYLYSLEIISSTISASADGGPRSRVCARETLRSAPHQH